MPFARCSSMEWEESVISLVKDFRQVLMCWKMMNSTNRFMG